MRRLASCLFLILLAVTSCAASEETIGSLKARLQNAPPDEQPQLAVQIAHLELRAADKFYNEGHVDEARTAVADIVTYSEKARDSAVATKKHLKNVEIATRKIAEKLRDIKRTLAFEDQPPVDQAIHSLEDIRTALLKEMFASDKDKK